MLNRVIWQVVRNMVLIVGPYILFSSTILMFWVFVLVFTVTVHTKKLEENIETRVLCAIFYVLFAFVMWTVPYMVLGVKGFALSLALEILWQHWLYYNNY